MDENNNPNGQGYYGPDNSYDQNAQYNNYNSNDGYANNSSYNPNYVNNNQFGGDESIFRPMSAWGNVGYDILFNLPVVGFILAIIFAVDDTYIARRNYARSKFLSLLLIIPIMVFLIISSVMILNSTRSTIGSSNSINRLAQYAAFVQEFGDYSDSFRIDSANARQMTGLKGQNVNNAQMYYMAAHGYSDLDGDASYIKDMTMPVGYELALNDSSKYAGDTLTNLLQGSTYSYYSSSNNSDEDFVAYVINDGETSYAMSKGDNKSDGSASREFYGDSNGKEYHFVTSNGVVFTLPGYPVSQNDGTIDYYIDNRSGHYYVAKGSSDLSLGDLNENGDEVKALSAIQAKDLTRVKGIDKDGNYVNTMPSNEPSTNLIGR